MKSKLTLLLVAFLFTLNASSQTWTTNGSSAVCKTNGNNVRLTVKHNGSVWIGDSTGTQKSSSTILYVDGTTKVRELIVNMDNWPDYVFDSAYILLPLEKVEVFIDSAHHLPNIPNQDSMTTTGLAVGEMNALMMRKIEELQLYILQLNGRIKELEAKQ